MNSLEFTDKELIWLNDLLRARVCSDLSLVYLQNASFDNKILVIKHLGVTLDINPDDFSSLSFFQDMYSKTDKKTIVQDIFRLIFSYLTRDEEYGCNEKDNHDRFRATASAAYKSRTLERPLVDECFDIIRQIVMRHLPQIQLLKHQPKTFVSCDVDNPYESYTINQRSLIRKLGGDFLKRRSALEFLRTINNYVRTRRGDYTADPNNTFDWMMDVNEKAGNKMAFYFLVDQSVPAMDAHYSIDEPRIRALIRRIYDRGHEIGLHASYGTYKNPQQIKKEVDKLSRVMDEEGVKQDEIGSRQHYLRWSTPDTARHLDAAGIDYDTTLGYAEHVGFRCGTCHEFPMFDIQNQQILNLRERPLVMMEASIFNRNYMNMEYSEETLNYLKTLKDTCNHYGGSFTMLWHNSNIRCEEDKFFYKELIY